MKANRGLVYLFTLVALVKTDSPCIVRETDYGTVCVCNSTYCDTIPPVAELESGEYQLYSTSKANLGFSSIVGNFSNSSDSADVTVTISDVDTTYQNILGFGAAFTDATGINILKLSDDTQEVLLQAYWGEDGVQYSIGRIPIGGTDFSTRGYTYCDVEDETLDSFALQEEDTLYKVRTTTCVLCPCCISSAGYCAPMFGKVR